jgi:hypothetical protein
MQTNSSNTRSMAMGWLEVIMVTRDEKESNERHDKCASTKRQAGRDKRK